MALDGSMLYIIKTELNSKAVGSRIEKISMPYRDRLVFSLSCRDFTGRLLISCNPISPRIHLTNEKFENPSTPPMLCMLLRKRLIGGRLREVRQAGIDRVLFLDFECKNELGDDILITVALEIMGRLSNIIILQEGKIIDSVRRFDPEEGKRFILPGAAYELPPSQDKINLLENEPQTIIERIKSGNDIPLSKALTGTIDGIAPIIGREIAFKACNQTDTTVSCLDENNYKRLESLLFELKQSILSGGKPTLVLDKENIPKDFTFIDIEQYGATYTTRECSDYGNLMDTFYSKKDLAEQMRQQSSGLLKLLSNLSERTSRKINVRKQELRSTEKREQLREFGELIKANLHLVKSGDSFLDAVNYYDPECKTIHIPLDVALSPSKNAQKYFKEYRKASTAANMLSELIKNAEDELVYIESVFDSLTRAKTDIDLAQIKQELIESGYLKATVKRGSKLKPIKASPLKYTSSDGYTIYVGKNNHQNDFLTLKIAAKSDIWLHTKNIPGSHVIIVTDGGVVPERTIEQAAILAALNSKASASRQVPVDYALVKYVKKPSGAKPGMVIYTNNKTAYVDPNESILEILQKN